MTFRSLWSSKRGITPWISWVLIIGLAVILGTFFFSWAQGFTEDTTADILERGDLVTLCAQVGINADGVCQQTQTLNINVSNNRNLRVEALLFRSFDIYGLPQSKQRNVSLDPGDTAELIVVKQGILRQTEVIPLVKNDDSRVLCQSRAITLESLPFC